MILLGHHDKKGALGWVINGDAVMTVGELLSSSGLVPGDVELPLSRAFSRPARLGGPVDPATGWMLYRHQDFSHDGGFSIGDGISVTGESSVLAAAMRGQGPKDFRLFVGYSGWGPGQLEREIREGSWLPTPVDEKLVFDTDAAAIWEQGYRRSVGTGPGAFVSSRRGAN